MRRTGECKTVVVGVGNPLMGDEGIGLHVVKELEKRAGVLEDIDVFEAGTSPLGMVHILSNRRKAVLIDCARMGRNPGEMCRFSPEEVCSLKQLPGFSLHEGDLLTSLEISRRTGDYPEEVVILGIEPGSVAFGAPISSRLQGRLGDYVQAVLEEIGQKT